VHYRVILAMRTSNKNIYKMDLLITPPMPEYVPGDKILTKHKEAICQLYKLAKFMPSHLAVLYGIRESLINHVLWYNKPK
jgi:hypothetical protein